MGTVSRESRAAILRNILAHARAARLDKSVALIEAALRRCSSEGPRAGRA